jgi:hypothetical protein
MDQETRLDVFLEELGLAREATAAAQAARLRFMHGALLLMLALFLVGWTAALPMAALALPFMAIYVVIQYAFITHSIQYLRAHAAGLESRVNSEAGENLLVRETLAARTVGPLGRVHFLGISGENYQSIFSVTTIHWCVLCLLFFVAGCMRTRYIISNPELSPVQRLGEIYFPLLFLWLLLNALYLVYYYKFTDHEQKLIAAIRKEYQPKGE